MRSSVNIILLPSPFELHINTAKANRRTLRTLALDSRHFFSTVRGPLGERVGMERDGSCFEGGFWMGNVKREVRGYWRVKDDAVMGD